MARARAARAHSLAAGAVMRLAASQPRIRGGGERLRWYSGDAGVGCPATSQPGRSDHILAAPVSSLWPRAHGRMARWTSRACALLGVESETDEVMYGVDRRCSYARW
jgi:hypothetical protein